MYFILQVHAFIMFLPLVSFMYDGHEFPPERVHLRAIHTFITPANYSGLVIRQKVYILVHHTSARGRLRVWRRREPWAVQV
jgi:hypothetical protein